VDAFACPPDCGWCCTHLHREVPLAEARATREFRAVLRGEGVYHCGDAVTTGLSLSNAEAALLRADPRGAKIHPRTFLLESRRRVAVVLDWHLPHAVCPFYSDHKCTVYEHRPLPCRAYPVMRSSPLKLAPECKKGGLGGLPPRVRPQHPAPPLSSFRPELRARSAIERAHAALDEDAMRVLAVGRFARGLSTADARERLKRYRVKSPQEFLAHARPA